MSSEVYWFVELAVRPGALAEFLQLTEQMVEASRQEYGTLVYERALSSDERLIIAHERYQSSEAALQHLRHFRDCYSARFDALVQRKTFTVVGDINDELRQLLTALGARLFLPSSGFSRQVPRHETGPIPV